MQGDRAQRGNELTRDGASETGPSDEASKVLYELSSLILSEEALQTTLKRVVDLTGRVLPTANAGVTLLQKGKLLTTATTARLVDTVDEIQYRLGEGPCLQAMDTHQVVEAPDLDTDDRWPTFKDQAAAHGVHGALAFPLEVAGESLGGLNIYFAKVGAFDAARMGLARMFAQQAAISIYNSRLFSDSVKLGQQLEEALVSRAVIDQAKGILMERENVDPDQAFEMLRRASQELNLKVRDIAHQIVDGFKAQEDTN